MRKDRFYKVYNMRETTHHDSRKSGPVEEILNSVAARSVAQSAGRAGRSRRAKSKYGVCIAPRNNNTQTKRSDGARSGAVVVAVAAAGGRIFSSRFVFTVSLSIASRMRHRRNVVGRPTGFGRG